MYTVTNRKLNIVGRTKIWEYRVSDPDMQQVFLVTAEQAGETVTWTCTCGGEGICRHIRFADIDLDNCLQQQKRAQEIIARAL